MDDPAAADVETDVPEAVEEDEVAGLQAARIDGPAVAVLRRGIVWQRDAELAVDVGDEPGAVEPARRAAAVAIRDAELVGRNLHGALPEREVGDAVPHRDGPERHRAREAGGVRDAGHRGGRRHGPSRCRGDGRTRDEEQAEREQADAGWKGHEE